MWNIKKVISKGDYLYALVPEHPNATKNGYVLLHRVVVENHLGRVLNTNEVVHHKDHNKKNNVIENLEILDRQEHSKIHGQEGGRLVVKLKCPWCKKSLFNLEIKLICRSLVNITVLAAVIVAEVNYIGIYNFMD